MPLLTFYIQLKKIFKEALNEDISLLDVTSPQRKRFMSQLKMFLRFYDYISYLKTTLLELHGNEAGHQVDIQLKSETFLTVSHRLQLLKNGMHNVLPLVK